MIGFFSFTEVTDPEAHRAYNEWHQLDHLPQQFTLDGVLFGQRWVCTPECAASRVAVSPELAPCHYMTLYLMRDAGVVPGFMALAQDLRRADRFFESRISHLSGPFEVGERWVAPRVRVSADVVPFRPSNGVFVVVGPEVDGASLVGVDGVAGAWSFTDPGRAVTVAFMDGELATVSQALGRWCLDSGESVTCAAWAGPLARIDAGRWDWFDRLTP